MSDCHAANDCGYEFVSSEFQLRECKSLDSNEQCSSHISNDHNHCKEVNCKIKRKENITDKNTVTWNSTNTNNVICVVDNLTIKSNNDKRTSHLERTDYEICSSASNGASDTNTSTNPIIDEHESMTGVQCKDAVSVYNNSEEQKEGNAADKKNLYNNNHHNSDDIIDDDDDDDDDINIVDKQKLDFLGKCECIKTMPLITRNNMSIISEECYNACCEEAEIVQTNDHLCDINVNNISNNNNNNNNNNNKKLLEQSNNNNQHILGNNNNNNNNMEKITEQKTIFPHQRNVNKNDDNLHSFYDCNRKNVRKVCKLPDENGDTHTQESHAENEISNKEPNAANSKYRDNNTIKGTYDEHDVNNTCPTCEVSTKQVGIKHNRSSCFPQTPFYSIPLPTRRGSVITLHSLSQLWELVDNEVFLPSMTQINQRETSSTCKDTNTSNTLSKYSTIAEQSPELHTALHAGETVIILLHYGNAVLRHVITEETRSLAQVRIYTLNLETLPPQDYYNALWCNKMTDYIEELENKKSKKELDDDVCLVSEAQNTLYDNSYIPTSSSINNCTDKKNVNNSTYTHSVSEKTNYHDARLAHNSSNKPNYYVNNETYLEELNYKHFSEEQLQEEKEEEEEEEEEENEEEEMTLITPHKYLSSQCTSLYSSPSQLLSPPQLLPELPVFVSSALHTKSTDCESIIAQSALHFGLEAETPQHFQEYNNCDKCNNYSLASAMLSAREYVIKHVNNKLRINLEMEISLSHQIYRQIMAAAYSSIWNVLNTNFEYFMKKVNDINTSITSTSDNNACGDNNSNVSLSVNGNNRHKCRRSRLCDILRSYMGEITSSVEEKTPSYLHVNNVDNSAVIKRDHTISTNHKSNRENDKSRKERGNYNIQQQSNEDCEISAIANVDDNRVENDSCESISFKSCEMIVWRAPCGFTEEYPSEPPFVNGEPIPVSAAFINSNVSIYNNNNNNKHTMTTKNISTKNDKLHSTNVTNAIVIGETDTTRYDMQPPNKSNENTNADNSLQEVSTFDYNETEVKEWYRNYVACDGDALIVKYIQHVDKLHSLAMWVPVYTPIHLSRAIASAFYSKLERITSLPESVAAKSKLEPSFTLLYLGASWCPPCMRFVQTMPELMHHNALTNVHVTVKADMDLAQPIYKCFDVSIIPTFIIFNNSRVIEAWEELHLKQDAGTWNDEQAAICETLLRNAEIGRIQNSELSTIITFIEKHCTTLSFDEDF